MGQALAIKIFSLLIAFFSIIFVFLGLQDAYFLDIKNYGLDFKFMEAKNLQGWELNSSKISKNYQAKSWERYEKRDVFKDFFHQNLDFNLSAGELEILNKNEKIILRQNVLYKDAQGEIKTQFAEYEPKNKILKSDDSFEANFNSNIVRGKTFSYDLDKKIFKTQKVKAWLREN